MPRGDMSLEQEQFETRCSGTAFSVLFAVEMAEAPEQHLFRMEPRFFDPNCSAPFRQARLIPSRRGAS
jgi:hypothetical protein